MKVLSVAAAILAGATAVAAMSVHNKLRVGHDERSGSDPDFGAGSDPDLGAGGAAAGNTVGAAVEAVLGDRVYHPTKVQLAAMNVLAYNKECDEDPETMGQYFDDYAKWYWAYDPQNSMTHDEAKAVAPDVSALLEVDHSCILNYATAQQYVCDQTWHQTHPDREDSFTGDLGGDWGSAGHLYKSGKASNNPYPRRKFQPTPTGYSMEPENNFYEVFPNGAATPFSPYRAWEHICVVVIRGSDDLRNGKAVVNLSWLDDDLLAGGPDGVADTDDRVTSVEKPFSFPANIGGQRPGGAGQQSPNDIGATVWSYMHRGLMSYYEFRVKDYISSWRTSETDCGLWMYSGHSLGGSMAAIAAISFDPKGCPPVNGPGIGSCGHTLRQQQGQAYTFGALAPFYTGTTLKQQAADNWTGGFRLYHEHDPAAQLAAYPGEGSMDSREHKGMQHRGGAGTGAVKIQGMVGKPTYMSSPTGGQCPDVIIAAYRDTKGCHWKTHRIWGGAYLQTIMNDDIFWTPGSRTDWLVGGSDQAGWTCNPITPGTWDPTNGLGQDVVNFMRDLTGRPGPNP